MRKGAINMLNTVAIGARNIYGNVVLHTCQYLPCPFILYHCLCS